MKNNLVEDTVDTTYKLVLNVIIDNLIAEEYKWLIDNKQEELDVLISESASEALDGFISYYKKELDFKDVIKKVNNFVTPKLKELLEDGYFHQTNPLRSSLPFIDVGYELVDSSNVQDTNTKTEELEEFLRETVLGLGMDYEDYYGEVYITDYFEEDPKPKVLAIIKAEKEGNYYEVETEKGLYIPLSKEYLLDFLVQSKVS